MKVIAKEVDMIACFTRGGDIKPIRFKLIDEEECEKVIKINQVITKKLSKMAGMHTYIFNCFVLLNEIQMLCEIRYEIDTCKWMLFKI